MIRLAAPDIDDDDIAAVIDTLRSGQLVQQVQVAEFERAVAAACTVPAAVAVNSCTSALHLALVAVGVREGDAVAVAPYSWPASANVIELCGARPVFIDITPDTWTMDPPQLAAALRDDRRIRAVLPVHTFGVMADMRAIGAIAAGNGVPIVEDAACALGASLRGRSAGSWGSLGCLSFHPRKAVTTGEGGAVVGSDDQRLATVRRLRNHGQDFTSGAVDFVEPGYNLRLTEFQAALGLAQLRKLERLIAMRRERATRYDSLLEALPLTRPASLPDSVHVYQSYVVLLTPEARSRRDEVIAKLRSQGVEAQIGTHHIPGLSYYRNRYGSRAGECPISADIAARAIALPLHTHLTEDDQSHVVDVLRRLL